MAQIHESEEVVTLDEGPLRLLFRWDERRWSHEVWVEGDMLASTLEWEEGRDDPSRVLSPAFQHLNAGMTGSGARALLVGQWGKHHGSAVFEIRRKGEDVEVDVDLAVRTRAEIHAIACTYTVQRSSGDLIDAGPEGIVWSLAENETILRFEPGGDEATRVGMAEAGRRLTRVQATVDIVEGILTHRLHYRWRWLGGNGTG